MSIAWLLSGPDPRLGPERLRDHERRLGRLPAAGEDLIQTLERSGLRGRGGASFPAGRKWRTVAGAGRVSAVVANGAEGDPLSAKDSTLMAVRPHLVLDGAFLAAAAVRAERVIVYIGRHHAAARAAMSQALSERPAADAARARLVAAPAGYVSGEESAAVHFLNGGAAVPTKVPPRPFERGVAARPTLVQNVESLAHVALIGRFGDAWYRSAGRHGGAGTRLVTLNGAIRSPGVHEVEDGIRLGDLIAHAGGTTAQPGAVLVGGCFGRWLGAGEAWALPLVGPASATQPSPGSGALSVLPAGFCGVAKTAEMMNYLAGESAAQCGPCFFGLRALAGAVSRIADGSARAGELERLHRWAHEVRGRGACHHPDGAAGLLLSALRVFGAEFEMHQSTGRCLAA